MTCVAIPAVQEGNVFCRAAGEMGPGRSGIKGTRETGISLSAAKTRAFHGESALRKTLMLRMNNRGDERSYLTE
jgi:hypothetical protein